MNIDCTKNDCGVAVEDQIEQNLTKMILSWILNRNKLKFRNIM